MMFIRYTLILFFSIIAVKFVNAQPVSLRSDITIREAGSLGNTVRIKRNPVSGNIYILNINGEVKRADIKNNAPAVFTTVITAADAGLEDNDVLGMAFGKGGTIFLVGNKTSQANPQLGVATIVRGVPDSAGSENFTWNVAAKTVEYNFGNTYNHRMSGITVDSSGTYIYVNSGARTDHGELRQGMRETGLTSVILKLPADADSIILQDDREWLRSNGYLFAEGIRNDFDLAFGPKGDLFSIENSGDRDDPEEMNWLREGHHYGFPWVIGGNNTPQQYSPYDPHMDPLLSPKAWGGGQGQLYITFSNDSTYPPRPAGVTFTSAITSSGPDGDKFRDTTNGTIKDAGNTGDTITTFTPHRSPNGFVFDNDSILVNDLAGGAFVISYSNGTTLHDLGDQGQDLLHVSLTKGAGNYHARVTQLVSGFNAPLGIEMVDNKIYVGETGVAGNRSPKLWEITLPLKLSTAVSDNVIPGGYNLLQNYPNPFNPSTTITYDIASSELVTLKVYDMLGNEIAVLVNEKQPAGRHAVNFNGSAFSSGVYFYKITAGSFIDVKKLIMMK